MSKQAIISMIISKLSSVGIQCIMDRSADITINQRFMEAEWNNGRRRIDYQASALLDEKEQVVYLWELTKEFGSSVKTIHNGIDGNSYEIKIDLEIIPKTFKDTARQFGWKYKAVYKKEKASYPPGIIKAPPVLQAQLQIPVIQQVQNPPPDNYNYVPLAAVYPTACEGGNSKQGFGAFFAAFLFIALLTSIFLLIGKNDEMGWILCALVLATYLILGRSFSAKGCLFQIMTFSTFSTILILIFIFTSPAYDPKLLDNPSDSAQGASSAEAIAGDAGINSIEENPVFRIDYLKYEMYAAYTYEDYSMQKMNLAASGDITLGLFCNPAALGKPDDKVKKINMTVKAVKGPTVGKVKLYTVGMGSIYAPVWPDERWKYGLPQSFDLYIADKYTETEEPQKHNLAFYNETNSGQIRIFYCIEDILEVDKTLSSWVDSIDAANAMGIDSKSIRSTVGIELNMEMASGDRHRIYFEREMVPGDFFVKGGHENAVEDYQGIDSPIVSSVVK